MSPAQPCTEPFNDSPSTTERHIHVALVVDLYEDLSEPCDENPCVSRNCRPLRAN